jgi:hypothetical protein
MGIKMSHAKPEPTCPGCRGANLCLGTVGHAATFRPDNAGLFSLNYPIRAFVCLDCGLVGYHMDAGTREKLRAKQA